MFAALALVFFAVLTFSALAPATAHADSRVWPTGYWGPLLSCTGNYLDPSATAGVSDHKTCTDVCDLLYTGQNIIDFATTIVIFVGAPVMVMFGGVLLLTGNMASIGGDEKNKRSMAKSVIVSAVIGVGITLGAYIIISTFLWFAGVATTGGGTATSTGIEISWPDIKCKVPPATTR